MITFLDRFRLGFSNLSVRTLCTEYFNELEEISVSDGYWQRYIGQIPAQAFDKANENFFRTSFYELCTRYLGRDFHLGIEVNSHSGRCDWQAMGRHGSAFEGKGCVIEFRHFGRKEGKTLGILLLASPLPADSEQVERYAADLRRVHPELTIVRSVANTVARTGGRLLVLA